MVSYKNKGCDVVSWGRKHREMEIWGLERFGGCSGLEEQGNSGPEGGTAQMVTQHCCVLLRWSHIWPWGQV